MSRPLLSILQASQVNDARFSHIFVLRPISSSECLNKIIFSDLPSLDLSSEAAKWALIRSIVAKISVYVFFHIFLVMIIRIFTLRGSPATVEDPNSIKLLNRIITSSIEQAVVFLGLYTYFIRHRSVIYFHNEGDRFSDSQLMIFASWFLIARLIFSVTQLDSSAISIPNFWAFGMAINLIVTILLLELNFVPVTYVSDFFFRK